jgi:hypothetical protein
LQTSGKSSSRVDSSRFPARYPLALTGRKQMADCTGVHQFRGPEYFHLIAFGALPPEPMDDETG